MCLTVKTKKAKKKTPVDTTLLHQVGLDVVLQHRDQSTDQRALTEIIPHGREVYSCLQKVQQAAAPADQHQRFTRHSSLRSHLK